jgi:O-succinylbenzoate synthase
MPLKVPFRTSFGETRLRPALLVRVEEKGGEEGWGEVVAGEGPWYSCETFETAFHVIRDYLVEALEKSGGDPWAFLQAASRIRGHNMAKAGLEEALWDLQARHAGLPLWKALGGVREYVESGVSVGIAPNIETLLDWVSSYLEAGYQRIKLKIKPGWDVNVVERVRREFPDVPLQVDANAAYTLADIEVFRKMENTHLLMIEQPLDPDDLVDHAILASKLRTPICLDESIKKPKHAIDALKLESAQVINLKPGRVGGLSESLRIHDIWYCQAGRPLWIGGMLETGIGRAHLVALGTLPGVSYPNDISASERYYDEDLVEPPWTLTREGRILAPDKPGIGVEILHDRVEKYSKRRWRARLA